MKSDVVKEIGIKEWENLVEKGKRPIAVMFYSPTCAYCHAIEPNFNEYAGEFKDKMLFVKVNVMNNSFIAERYGIMATPSFKFFCQGLPVQELVGGVYPPLLKKTIEEVLKNGEKCVKNSSIIDYSITGYA